MYKNILNLLIALSLITVSCSKNNSSNLAVPAKKTISDTVRVIDNDSLGTRTFIYPSGKKIVTNTIKGKSKIRLNIKNSDTIKNAQVESLDLTNTYSYSNEDVIVDPEFGFRWPPIRVFFIAGLGYSVNGMWGPYSNYITDITYAYVEVAPTSVHYQNDFGDTRSAGTSRGDQQWYLQSILPSKTVDIGFHYSIIVVYMIKDFPSYRTYLFDKVQRFPA